MPFLFDDADHGPAILNPRNLLGDILHTTDGGVSQYAGGPNFKLLLVRADYVFGVAHANQKVMQQRAMLHVNRELQRWHLTKEGIQYEPLSFVTYPTLVGSAPNDTCIAAKTMQSSTLFMFSAWLLNNRLARFRRVPEGEANNFQTAQGLLRSSQCLKAWYTLVFENPTHVPTQEAARILAFAKKACRSMAGSLWKHRETDTPCFNSHVQKHSKIGKPGMPQHLH